MRFVFLVGLLFLILAVQSFAQTATLQGIVTTETDGQPLEGANITLEYIQDEFGVQRVIIDDFYQGRMLPLHRLDFSAERSFDWYGGQIHIKAGATNLYDRENMFYYDVFTHQRVNQLPLAPYVTLEVGVE